LSAQPPIAENEIGAVLTYGLADALPAITFAKFRAEMVKSRLQMLLQVAHRVTMIGWGFYMIARRQALLHLIEDSARLRLQMSQVRLQQAVAKFGPASQEAREAERNLVIAQNMQERSHTRTTMMMQAQYLQVFQMGSGLLFTLKRLHTDWIRASAQQSAARAIGNTGQIIKNRRLLQFRTVLLAVSIATSIAVNILTLGVGVPGADVATQAVAEVAPDEFHAGGVSGHGGLSWLEKGETLSATKWFTKPLTITIRPPPGTPESEVARELFERVQVLKGE